MASALNQSGSRRRRVAVCFRSSGARTLLLPKCATGPREDWCAQVELTEYLRPNHKIQAMRPAGIRATKIGSSYSLSDNSIDLWSRYHSLQKKLAPCRSERSRGSSVSRVRSGLGRLGAHFVGPQAQC